MSDDTDYGFDSGIEIEPANPGYEATFQRGDGTATTAWGPTEDEAKANLEREIKPETDQ